MPYLLYALLLLGMLTAATVNADDTLSGKPYSKSIDLDVSLPDDLHDELPELGDVSETVLSAQDEQRIAEQILAEVAVSDEVLQDVEIVDYLQTIGNRLAAASDDKQQTFYFLLLRIHPLMRLQCQVV